MESLLKYFQVKYNLSELVSYKHNDKQNIIQIYSISKIKVLQLFFKVVLDYYYKNNIELDYTESTVHNKTKTSIIKNIYPIIYEAKAIKIYDLVDFMFKTFKKVLISTKKGFVKWVQTIPTNLDFITTIIPNIDLFFYIIFVQVFPNDLRVQLKKELVISDLEYNIIDKCHGLIIRNNNQLCNLYINPVKNKKLLGFLHNRNTKVESEISLDKIEGIITILKIFNDLRDSSLRRNNLN